MEFYIGGRDEEPTPVPGPSFKTAAVELDAAQLEVKRQRNLTAAGLIQKTVMDAEDRVVTELQQLSRQTAATAELLKRMDDRQTEKSSHSPVQPAVAATSVQRPSLLLPAIITAAVMLMTYLWLNPEIFPQPDSPNPSPGSLLDDGPSVPIATDLPDSNPIFDLDRKYAQARGDVFAKAATMEFDSFVDFVTFIDGELNGKGDPESPSYKPGVQQTTYQPYIDELTALDTPDWDNAAMQQFMKQKAKESKW